MMPTAKKIKLNFDCTFGSFFTTQRWKNWIKTNPDIIKNGKVKIIKTKRRIQNEKSINASC